jgi:hypothetical protein
MAVDEHPDTRLEELLRALTGSSIRTTARGNCASGSSRPS